MNLRDFLSNSPAILDKLDPSVCTKIQITKVLGVLWDPVSDKIILKIHPPSQLE